MVVLLLLLAILLLSPFFLLGCKKKSTSSGTSLKTSCDQDVRERLDKLDKEFEGHRCLKKDVCFGCSDYATGIESLWRSKPKRVSEETRKRLNKKHTEIGERFELLAGKWVRRGDEKELQLEATQKSSKMRTVKKEEKLKSKDQMTEDASRPAEPDGRDEPAYENLIEPLAFVTQETQDTEG